MARILIRREAFERGQFPPVCCKTGQQGDLYSRWEFMHAPGWTYILILFGILPFLIATMFVTRRFDGILPIASGAQARLNSARRFVWVFGVAGIALGLTGLFLSEPLLLGIAATVLVAWLITMVCVWLWSPGARLDDDGVVELLRLHPSFVEAIRATARPAAPPPVDA